MYIDDKSEFSTFKPSPIVSLIIEITRSVGDSWIAKRIIFILRRFAILLSKDCIDTELINAKIRLYTKGNICEKRALFSPQIFESYERNYIAKHAENNSVFIDIGSNVGLYSLSVSNNYVNFQGTQIHSIEPHPGLYKRLKYNASVNQNFPIKTHNLAIMDRDGEFYLDSNSDNLGQSTINEEGQFKVTGKTLKNFISSQNIHRIDSLKIDVEGNEEKALIPFMNEKNRKIFPKIIIIENNSSSWKTDLMHHLTNLGYSVHKKTRMNYILNLNK